jgi:hypothetical protein
MFDSRGIRKDTAAIGIFVADVAKRSTALLL